MPEFGKRVEKSSTWLSAGDLQSPPSFPAIVCLFASRVYVGAIPSTTSTASFSSPAHCFFAVRSRLSCARTPEEIGGGGSLSRFEGGSIGIDADRFDSIAFSFKLYTMENGIWNIISFYLLVLAYSRRNLSFIDIVRVVLSSHETNDASSILSFFFFLSLIFRYIIII